MAGLARWKIIAIFLGPSGVGIAGVIDRTAQIALQLGALNIPTAALRFLAIAEEERGAEGFAWLYRTLLRALLSTAGIVAAIWVTVYLVWPESLGPNMAVYTAAAAFALAAVPATAATNLIRNVLATLHRHRAAATTLLVSSVLLAASTVAGIRIAGLGGAYFAALLVGLGTATALHMLVVPTLRGAPATRAGSLVALLKAHPDIVRFSLTLYAVGFAVPLSYGIVQWTVLRELGLHEAGFLAAGYTVASGLRAVFSQASTQYLIPLTSRSIPNEARAAEIAKYIRTLVLLLLVAVLPLLLFPYEVLLVLYSRQFAAATDVLGVFILAEVVMAISDAYRVLQLGFNDLVGYLMTTSTGVVIVVAGVGLVAPAFGLRGVAILQIAASVAVLAQSMHRVRSHDRIRLDWNALVLPAYVIAALGAAVAIGRGMPEPSIGQITTKAAIGLVLILGAWALLPRAERRTALRTLRRRQAD